MGNYDELLRFYSFSSLKMQMTAANSQEVIVLQINGSYAGQISNNFDVLHVHLLNRFYIYEI